MQVEAVQAVLDRYENQVASYRSGKKQIYGFFVGEIMKEMKGKANPKIVNEVLRKRLDSAEK